MTTWLLIITVSGFPTVLGMIATQAECLRLAPLISTSKTFKCVSYQATPGLAGPAGPMGPVGMIGATGPMGPQGPIGPAGPAAGGGTGNYLTAQ